MKICQLLVAGAGGLAKHVVDLSNALSEQRHDVTAIVPADFSGEFNDSVRVFRLKPQNKFTSHFYTLKLFFLIRKISPDVVHAHGKAASVHLARIKPFVRGRCVGTVHWNQKRRKDFRGFEQLDGVIGVSEPVLDLLESPRRTVIYNGAQEPEKFPRAKEELISNYQLNPDFPLAIAIGRLVHGKGFHNLVQAWQGVDANLLIVGDGPEYGRLSELVASYGLADRVRVAGAIPQAARMMDVADLTVVSSFREGFSYVLAESLLYRVPIVSTRVNGTEVLPLAAVVAVDDVAALHEKLVEVINNRAAFSAEFDSVFEWAKENLTVSKMADNVLAYYSSL
ncbi:glycosyltransferase [Spongiibacter tropicus]|uniref:glycosyltransferase n=1 Tax=Spongiibacter tropicus TaxID=454602 RepID=UPI0035BE8D47